MDQIFFLFYVTVVIKLLPVRDDEMVFALCCWIVPPAHQKKKNSSKGKKSKWVYSCIYSTKNTISTIKHTKKTINQR